MALTWGPTGTTDMPASNVLGPSVPLRRTSLLVAAVGLLACHASQAASFTVLGLPDTQGYATAASADGQVVAGWFAEGVPRAFRWTAAAGTEFLPADGTASAYGVSGDGRFVVGVARVEGNINRAPVRWDGTGQPEPLDTPSVDYVFAGAYGTSADGTVAAGSFGGWSESSGLFDIGGFGYDVSGDGSVIVGWAPPAGADANFKAIRWTQATGTQVIGPAPDVWRGSVARAVSADGMTIVGSGPGGAWLWTETEGTTYLDDPLDGIIFGGAAIDVSGDGSVVLSEGGDAIWLRGLGARRLSDLLTEQGVDGMENWMLLALGVSADGRTIVGGARSLLSSSGYYRPFIAQIDPVPIPAAAVLFGGAIAVLAGIRRRRSDPSS